MLKVGAGKLKKKISYTALPISDPLASLKGYLEDERKYEQLQKEREEAIKSKLEKEDASK
jgi:hypothetical protein